MSIKAKPKKADELMNIGKYKVTALLIFKNIISKPEQKSSLIVKTTIELDAYIYYVISELLKAYTKKRF